MKKLFTQLQSHFQPAAVCPHRWCPRSVRLGSLRPPPVCSPSAVISFRWVKCPSSSESSSSSRAPPAAPGPEASIKRFKLFLLCRVQVWHIQMWVLSPEIDFSHININRFFLDINLSWVNFVVSSSGWMWALSESEHLEESRCSDIKSNQLLQMRPFPRAKMQC